MCLYPRLIRNRRYVANKKNGGLVPSIPDPRVMYVPVGCQYCMECRKKKAREWQVRLSEDIKHYTNGRFVTFTFSNEKYIELVRDIPETEVKERPTADGNYITKEIQIHGTYQLDNAVATLAVRRFLERYRKRYGKSLRHWLVTELGHEGTQNIHLHGIIWTDIPLTEIENIWSYGYMWKGKREWVHTRYGRHAQLTNYVNEKTVNYIVKYMHKLDADHKTYKPKILLSAGIGSSYTQTSSSNYKQNRYNGTETNEAYRTRQGLKMALPIYYRNKIYNEQERQALWLQKLDKGERWICGERVDIRTSDAEYKKLLEYYQRRNTEMGYGNDNTWKLKHYEEQIRAMMQERRLMPDGYPKEWDN